MAVRENFVRGVYGTLKTRTSRRNIPPNTDALHELGKVGAASKFTGADHAVFAGQKSGQPLDQHNIAARFLRVAGKRKEVGCPWVSWHILMRTLPRRWLTVWGFRCRNGKGCFDTRLAQ